MTSLLLAALVALPAQTTDDDPEPPQKKEVVVRLVAAVAFADLALSEARWLPTRRAAVGAVGCGLVSVVVGLVARPAGGWHWGAIVDLRSVVVSVVAAVIIAAGVVAARWWLLRRRAEPVSG